MTRYPVGFSVRYHNQAGYCNRRTSWHSAWCWVDINHFVHVARPRVVTRGSDEPGLIAKAAKSMDGFDLVSKKRVNTLRPACRSCRQSCGCRAPSTRSGYWDLRPPSAAGGRPGSMNRLRGACEGTPEPLRHRRPCVPCRRRPSTLLKASPVLSRPTQPVHRPWAPSGRRRGSTSLSCCAFAVMQRGGWQMQQQGTVLVRQQPVDDHWPCGV